MLHYSILKYAPITSRSTYMTLGILFHEPSLDHREFRFTHDLSRLSQIDPELDLGLVQKLLVGIKEEVEQRSVGEKAFDIEDYTRFYINAFYFEGVQTVKYDVLDDAIEDVSKTYI